MTGLLGEKFEDLKEQDVEIIIYVYIKIPRIKIGVQMNLMTVRQVLTPVRNDEEEHGS